MITRCAKIVLAVAACTLLCGCWVYSVYPLSTGDELLVFEKSMLGTWWQPEAGCTLTLSRFYEEKVYRVVYSAPAKRGGGGCLIDEGRSASFEGRLVRFNGYDFLDLLPTDREKQQHHELLLHSFYKVTRLGDRLTLIPLDNDWVKAQWRQHRVTATTQDQSQQSRGVVIEDEEGKTGGSSSTLVLTMETDALQRFVSDHADDEEAFPPGKGIVFHKRQE